MELDTQAPGHHVGPDLHPERRAARGAQSDQRGCHWSSGCTARRPEGTQGGYPGVHVSHDLGRKRG